jgi:hypothetical protein
MNKSNSILIGLKLDPSIYTQWKRLKLVLKRILVQNKSNLLMNIILYNTLTLQLFAINKVN